MLYSGNSADLLRPNRLLYTNFSDSLVTVECFGPPRAHERHKLNRNRFNQIVLLIE